MQTRRSCRLFQFVLAVGALSVGSLVADTSQAQLPPLPPIPGMPQPAQPQPGQPQPGQPAPGQPGYGQPGYGQPGYGQPPPPRRGRPVSTGLEMGYLYVAAAGWGVGTGIWIDAEAEIGDPGLMLIAPAVIGVAAPVGVFLIDRFAYSKGMPEGLPSAVATGLLVGGGEGLGIASLQWVRTEEENAWGFKGLARAEVIASTLGGGAGYGLYYALRPEPQTNILIASGVGWGAIVGTLFGGGASNGDWGAYTNDGMALGGLIGYNVGLAATVGASFAGWVPSWSQIGWGWGGLALGAAASMPVYIFYAGSEEYDARRGMIFQAVAGTIGMGLGLTLAPPYKKQSGYAQNEERNPDIVTILGGTVTPIEGGAAARMYGLW